MNTEFFCVGLVVRITGDDREGPWLPEIADAQVGRTQECCVSVIKQARQPSIMPGRIVSFAGGADEWQERRTRGCGDPRVGAARGATMIPGDESYAGLCH